MTDPAFRAPLMEVTVQIIMRHGGAVSLEFEDSSDSEKVLEKPRVDSALIKPCFPDANPIIARSIQLDAKPRFKLRVPEPSIRSLPFSHSSDYSCEFAQVRAHPLVYLRGRDLNSNFNSEFQSGNLEAVCATGPRQFTCLMSRDSNSRLYGCWFYFKAKGLRGLTTFKVIPFKKQKLLFSRGMQICVGTEKGWSRGGRVTGYAFYERVGEVDYYALSFVYDFKSDSEVSFATGFPYTERDLKSCLSGLRGARTAQLGLSLCNRPIPAVTFGEDSTRKPVIVVNARSHPCESAASWIVEGLMQALSEEKSALREMFQFFVVPMLNVDGVAMGNSRFSAAGCDLNRQWARPADATPEVFHLKKKLLQLIRSREVRLVLDLHGHSRRHSLFAYGCIDPPFSNTKAKKLPFLLSKITTDFSFPGCNFKIAEDKLTTLRAVVHRASESLRRGVLVYTLEASFMGSEGTNWQVCDYKRLGRVVLEGINRLSQKKESYWEALEASSPQFRESGFRDSSGSDSSPERGQNETLTRVSKDSPGRKTNNFVELPGPTNSERSGRKRADFRKLAASRHEQQQSKMASNIYSLQKAESPIKRSLESDQSRIRMPSRKQTRTIAARSMARERRAGQQLEVTTIYFGEKESRTKCHVPRAAGQSEELFVPKGYNLQRLRLLRVGGNDSQSRQAARI